MRQKEIFPDDRFTGVSRWQSGIEIVSGFIFFEIKKNKKIPNQNTFGHPGDFPKSILVCFF